MSKRIIVGLILFIAVFCFYLHFVAPSVAPYRDAGEMATVSSLLGVAHPPGYPLYIIAGNIFSRIMLFGDTAYRLNIFSALAMAGSIVLVYNVLIILAAEAGIILSGMFCLVLACAGGFWYISQVSEMYAANIFACILVLWILVRSGDLSERRIFLAAFLSGLFLGFRMDLVLVFPAYGIFAARYLYRRKDRIMPVLLSSGLFFFTGLSIYLYLFYRSRTDPAINWGSPDTLEKLFNVLSRKTHGHTLDLLSTNYASGALFLPEMWIYLRHIFWEFTPAGLVLAGAGGYLWFKKNRIFFTACVTAFIITGPVFIFLGNMPPNPHALAIMEPHYLLPDLFLFCLAGGVLMIFRGIARTMGYGICVVLIGFNLFHFNARAGMRHNFFAVDYTKNILRNLPPHGMGVVKEDVQLFSLWYAQLVAGKRVRTPLIAQGLSGSSWYQKNMDRRFNNLRLYHLNDAEKWHNFVRLNPAYEIFITNDAEYQPSPLIQVMPYGIFNHLENPETQARVYLAGEGEIMMKEFHIRRGVYNYEYQLDYRMNFFNGDLIEDYASAWRKLGFVYMSDGLYDKTEECFYRAIYMKKIMPSVYYHLGYMYFSQAKYEKADAMYAYAEKKYENYLYLTGKYYTLPGVVASVKKEFSEVCLHHGVTREKLGDEETALHYFKKSAEIQPSFAQAYFNIATIYWKRESWGTVVYYMEQAVYYDQKNMKFRQYLAQARERAKT